MGCQIRSLPAKALEGDESVNSKQFTNGKLQNHNKKNKAKKKKHLFFVLYSSRDMLKASLENTNKELKSFG